jgi:2-oxoglutarate ferredoxin oxidoreductase subunit alpha
MSAMSADAAPSTRRLMEGSEAIAEAAIAAGCRFFAGYPMTPFTELLENFATKLPTAGGVCINAESELEAVGMAWGAVATGARAATGSTGQGLALMQESISELTRAELPLVIFNMARGQYDYYQATRGGGHGDYHHLVFAPIDSAEAVELTQLAFHVADKWRNPVMVYGDYLLAHTAQAVEVIPREFPELPPKDWAVDGSLGGSGVSRNVNPIGMTKGSKGIEPESFWRRLQSKWDAMAREEARIDVEFCEDAELVVVAFGTMARFVRFAVQELRDEGLRVGYARPITLWPFPTDGLIAAASGAKRVAVLEQNAGQMIDDVRLAILGSAPVVPIGGISSDEAGFGLGPLLDPEVIRERIRAAYNGEEVER